MVSSITSGLGIYAAPNTSRDILEELKMYLKFPSWEWDRNPFTSENMGRLSPEEREEFAFFCIDKNPELFWNLFDLINPLNQAALTQCIERTLDKIAQSGESELLAQAFQKRLKKCNLPYEQRVQIAQRMEQIYPRRFAKTLDAYELNDEDRFPFVMRYLDANRDEHRFFPTKEECWFDTYERRLAVAEKYHRFIGNELELTPDDFFKTMKRAMKTNAEYTEYNIELKGLNEEQKRELGRMYAENA